MTLLDLTIDKLYQERAARLCCSHVAVIGIYDYDRGFSLIPNSSGWWTREGEAFVEINSQGLRDIEREFNKIQKP